jgi:hypothetical protein
MSWSIPFTPSVLQSPRPCQNEFQNTLYYPVPCEIDRMTDIGNNKRQYMRLPEGRFPCFFLSLFFAGLLLFCGCATTTPDNLFTVSGPGWRIEQGQALWTPQHGAPQFGGDIVLATDGNGRSLAQFDKTPLTIVTVQVTPQQWTINFPQGGGFWKGHGSPPTRTVWPYLADALAGKKLPEPLHFEQKPDGNWRLENTKTGEILEGFLSP